MGLDKSLLGHILGFMGVAHKPHDQPENLVLVFQHQQIKSPLVSALHALDQLLILFLG